MEIINIFAAMAILIFGVPHGALDPLTAHRLGLIPSKIKILFFLIGYLAISGLAFYLWLLFPLLSFATEITFLIFSSILLITGLLITLLRVGPTLN